MNIVIDDKAGFCFGVVKAIGKAEEVLDVASHLYCLGDIVHNNAEVARLCNRGLEVIDIERLKQLSDTQVLIRAHGEPPSTYVMAKQRNIRLIDATCPIVLALQQKVRSGYEEMKKVGGQVVIYGKHGHAEVVGLNGQTDNTAVIISGKEDLANIDFACPVRLYSQTTQSRESYHHLSSLIREHMQTSDFKVFDTVCNRVANRASELREFACRVDVVLFVSGEHSSNGHYLFEYCRKVQPNTHFISDASQLKTEWLEGVQTIGVTGATSTPRWLMEQIATRLSNIKSLEDGSQSATLLTTKKIL